nr:copia protein [Tanacetum cinerariifolium]
MENYPNLHGWYLIKCEEYHRVCDIRHASALDFVSQESQISAILAAIELLSRYLYQFQNKAKLVAQDHTQDEGIDYDEVFVPVATIESIRLFLAYASFMGFTVYQIDVKSAFLYGTIDEEVYVMQPPRFQDPTFPAKVYKVEKAIPIEGGWHFSLTRQIYRRYSQEIRIFRLAFSDSDYGGASQDRKSTTGGSQFLSRRLISWQSKKQTIVATSTTIAKYVATASCCGQVLMDSESAA